MPSVLNHGFDSLGEAISSYRSVLEGLRVGICVWRLEEDATPASLRLIIINAIGAQFLHVTREDVLGRRIHEAFPGSETQPFPGVFAKIAMEGGDIDLGEVSYSDNVRKNLLLAIRAERIERRTVLVEFTNVTEQKRLEALQATNEELLLRLSAQAEAVSQEAERSGSLVLELEQKLQIIAQQNEQIQALSAPVLDVWKGVLAVPIIGELTSARAAVLAESVLEVVSTRQTRAVILDVTGISGLDAESAEHLGRIVAAVRLLGAEGLITGIRPQLARTLTELGHGGVELRTYRSLSDGLRVCIGGQLRAK